MRFQPFKLIAVQLGRSTLTIAVEKFKMGQHPFPLTPQDLGSFFREPFRFRAFRFVRRTAALPPCPLHGTWSPDRCLSSSLIYRPAGVFRGKENNQSRPTNGYCWNTSKDFNRGHNWDGWVLTILIWAQHVNGCYIMN